MNDENNCIDLEFERLLTSMKDFGVPDHCQRSLAQYIINHKPVGHFLTHLLCNDLTQTFLSSDHINANAVKNYVMFLYNVPPSACWGSPERVTNWLDNYHE